MSVRHAMLILTLLGMAACRPREGGRCEGSAAACVNPREGLFCNNGRYMRLQCLGANGCSTQDGAVRCDQSIATAGTHCIDTPGADVSCSPDSARALQCVGTTIQVLAECGGPTHCRIANGQILCDETDAQPGDLCTEGSVACSRDHSQGLHCENRHFAVTAVCRGPRQCWVEREPAVEIRCDSRVARIGDACLADGNGCSEDHMAMLSCVAGHFALHHDCRGPRHCENVEGSTQIRCDESIADAGAPCAEEGSAACTADLTQGLLCQGGTYHVARRCRGGCRNDNGTIICHE